MKYRDYKKPASLAELKALIESSEEKLTFFAGGTDMLVYAREDDRYANDIIVDIYDIPELKGITEEDGQIRIGAGTTHTEIELSPVVQKYAGILSQACATVGSHQIRDHATIAGNICNASPAADSLSALAVLKAEIEVLRKGALVRIPIADVIAGPYKTKLEPNDLVLAVYVRKLPEDYQCKFWKLGRRKALAISRMTISTILHLDAEGKVDDFSMTCGATFPSPMTFADIDAMMIGQKPSEELHAKVAKALSDKIPEIAGIRKSTTYKQPVCERIAFRILNNMLLGGEEV